MGFVQIISFRTDRRDEFDAVERDWLDATEGRRTVLREQALVDRSDPRHHVQVVEFDSWEAAQANSRLPETDAAAKRFAALADGEIEFGDFDVVQEYDARRTLAAALRSTMETNEIAADTFADDLQFEGQFPDHVVRGNGTDFLTFVLEHEQTPGRAVGCWHVTPTEHGFVVEYDYRTTTEPSTFSLGLLLATVESGRIARLVMTCAGAWDAATEARVLSGQEVPA
jgi:hypothetical protein